MACRFEVQIRTEEMHRIAEEGIAAHWKYKEGSERPRMTTTNALHGCGKLVEWQHEMSDSGDFLSTLKVDLYSDEVYTFTPKGQRDRIAAGMRRQSILPMRFIAT